MNRNANFKILRICSDVCVLSVLHCNGNFVLTCYWNFLCALCERTHCPWGQTAWLRLTDNYHSIAGLLEKSYCGSLSTGAPASTVHTMI